MKEGLLQNPSEEASSVLKCVQKAKALRQSQKVKLSTSLEEDNDEGLTFKIPSNWVLVSFDDIASKIHYGYTASAKFENTKIKLLRITDIQDNKVNWDNVPGCLIDDHTSPSYLLHRGDLLVARTGGTIGKTFLVKELPQPTVFASYLIRIVPNECVNPDFLKLYTGSPLYWNQLYERCKGTGQPNVNATSLKAFKIPLPPLPEQQRIVGILDEAFNDIATAKAKAEKNLKNARNLFESYLQSVFTQLGDGWVEKQLGEVCQIKPPKAEARRMLADTDLVSFVPMEDLGIDQKILVPTQTKSLAEVAGSYTYFADGDVLLAKITPCFENGKLGIAADLTNGIGFGSSEYIVFRPDKLVNKEWLYYYLSREVFRFEGAARMSGAVGHKRVSKEFIETYPIPIPAFPEQQRIVGILDEAFDGTKRLEFVYQRKLAALDELEKSLLHQAFNGQL